MRTSTAVHVHLKVCTFHYPPMQNDNVKWPKFCVVRTQSFPPVSRFKWDMTVERFWLLQVPRIFTFSYAYVYPYLPPPPPFANSQWKHHFWWRIRFSLRLFSVEKSRFLSLTFNLTQMIRPQLIAKRNSESKGLFFADLPMFYKFLRWLNADRGDFVMVSRGCVCFWGERATLVDAVTWFHDFQDQCLFWVWLPMKS